MKIITTAVIKGGTGKTTTAAALAQAAAADGKKVLAIDLDPQANLSAFIGADKAVGGSLLLLHGADPETLIQGTAQGIDAIVASPDLATERTTTGSAKRLQRALEPIRGRYDYIFIDTPPQIGELTYNALQASTGLIVPLETDGSSVQGLFQIADIARQMRRSNPALSILGVVLTRYDGRANLNKYIRNLIEEKARDLDAPFLIGIRPGIAIREAQAMQESLFEYAPRSNPAQDYKKLYNMIKEK